MKRLFIGLELPESLKVELANLDPGLRGVRWLRPEHIHLTMSFLGNVDSAGQERLCDALDQVHVPPFFLPVQGVGAFGGARPKVVWAGVGKGHPHLFALHKHVQDAVLRAGLEPDLRPFHPHITFGRARGVSRAQVLPFLRKYADAELGLWRVDCLTLFSSVLSPEGATHSIETQWEL